MSGSARWRELGRVAQDGNAEQRGVVGAIRRRRLDGSELPLVTGTGDGRRMMRGEERVTAFVFMLWDDRRSGSEKELHGSRRPRAVLALVNQRSVVGARDVANRQQMPGVEHVREQGQNRPGGDQDDPKPPRGAETEPQGNGGRLRQRNPATLVRSATGVKRKRNPVASRPEGPRRTRLSFRSCI
jgi:hypothetical protein